MHMPYNICIAVIKRNAKYLIYLIFVLLLLQIKSSYDEEKKFLPIQPSNLGGLAYPQNFQQIPEPEIRNVGRLLKTKINRTQTKIFFDENCFLKSFPNFDPPSNLKEDFDFLKTTEGKSYKTILFHNGYKNTFGFKLGHKPFELACCREKRCFLTNQREKIPIKEFDALLFDIRTIKSVQFPQEREKNQRWIFYEREAPTLTSKITHKFNGVFNWTMTYRTDSDIYSPYGKVYSKSIFKNKDLSKFIQNSSYVESLVKSKTKMAAWMTSRCKSPSKREVYVQSLQKYITVDIYGKCGPLKCDKSATRAPKCYEMIEKNYKFYLSFENSLCEDYVTEKLFNILQYNIVPVVRGTGHYTSIAPPHSYIDVEDFESVEELANYLNYLNGNDTAYLEYFKWKEDYISNPLAHPVSFCDLCEKLHNDFEEKVIYDLKEWFEIKANCHA